MARRSASGSGALGDFGSHLLDLLQYAAGVELAEAAEYIADTYDAVVIDDNTKLLAKEKDAPLASAPAK